ncbi:MAG: TetR/AcrR family transcriptional regulator [Streptomyces sp.]|jgi:AcrR family transcriptional regulator|nr:TetR/AcrR family transcriptional regulator [Streptomyces sp.]
MPKVSAKGRSRSADQDKPRDLRASLALLWGEQGRPTRGPKPSLSPQRIAATAVDLADTEGLDAVSMNKVAAGFGVSAMALYRYVPGKAELVELMVESVLAEGPDLSAVAGGDWRAGVSEWTRQCLRVYETHRWLLAATALRRQVMGPHQLHWLDVALRVLEPTGLTAPQRHQVFLLAVGLVRNLAQQLVDFDEEQEREWSRLTGELLERHADRFPALTRAVAEGAFADTGLDPLAFGLDRLLDGVQALIDSTDRD